MYTSNLRLQIMYRVTEKNFGVAGIDSCGVGIFSNV